MGCVPVRSGRQAMTLTLVPSEPEFASGKGPATDCSSDSAPDACTSIAFLSTATCTCWGNAERWVWTEALMAAAGEMFMANFQSAGHYRTMRASKPVSGIRSPDT